MNKVKIGKYKHYKGHFYQVICVAKHSEMLEELVVYEALYESLDGKYWVRPVKMFCEKVMLNGVEVPRFEYVVEK